MRTARAALLLAVCLAPLPAGAMEVTTGPAPVDCRYQHNPAPDGSGSKGFLLPADHLFRPLLADLKEPRFYGQLRRVHFRTAPFAANGDRQITAGLVGMGTNVGLWSQRREGTCDGYQIGIFAGSFSQFNLSAPSGNLLNTDFQVGFPLTLRRDPFSVRLQLYHQSSHLGDELLLNNPGITRRDLSFEAVELLGSVHGQYWRLYAGGTDRFRTNSGIDPASAQWGLELRWSGMLPYTNGVLGADFQAFEEQEWAVTTSLAAGPEFAAPHANQRIRILAVYLRGFIPFGQFFSETRLENFGMALQFEF